MGAKELNRNNHGDVKLERIFGSFFFSFAIAFIEHAGFVVMVCICPFNVYI